MQSLLTDRDAKGYILCKTDNLAVLERKPVNKICTLLKYHKNKCEKSIIRERYKWNLDTSPPHQQEI